MSDTEPIAVIRHDPGQLRRVAGVTLLERAVMALRKGGVQEVVVAVAPDARPALQGWLPGSRLSADPPPLADLEAGEEPASLRGIADRYGDRPALLLHDPVAIDWGFVGAVREGLEQGTVTAVSGMADGAITIHPRGTSDSEPVAAAVPAGTAVSVRSAADGRRARRALLAQSIKPLEIDGIVCYLLIRRLSVRLTTLMLPFPITPNLITAVSVLLGVAAAVAVGTGDYLWTVVGGSLLMASLIFDNCDGEVARVKYQFSDWGAWFDIYGDFVVNAAFMSGMAVGAYRALDQPLYLYAGAFAVFAFTFYNGTVFRYIHRLGIPDEFLFKWWFDQEAEAAAPTGDAAPAPAGEGPSALGRFLSGLKYLGRRDFFIFAYLVTAVLGVLHWAFWATVAGAAMNFVMTCYQVFFWKGLTDARRG